MTFNPKLITMTQMAMTNNFVRLATDDTESDFLEYKQWEEEKIIKADKLEKFDYTIIDWYHWKTLGCRTQEIYDLYRVFDYKWNIICESEDEVIELPKRCDNKKGIEIKAYDKLWDDRLILLAEWKKWVSRPTRWKLDYHQYKLSVIIPLYKAENFMCRTIDAILSSSLPMIQLILVNDGSPDNSLEIAKRYADNYGCVTVVDKPNSWCSESRNFWIALATWEYTAFCDADDIPHPYMYERLYNTCKEQWTDIAIWSVLIRNQPWIKEWYLRIWKDIVYTFDEMMSMKETKDNIYFVAVWNKIMKTEIAKMVKSPTEYAGKRFPYEDIAYTWSVYSYIDKFAYCNNAIYTWEKRKRQTEGTVSTWSNWESNDFIWTSWIFAASFPLYHKSWKHLERHDYRHFKRMIDAYKKFQWVSPLRTYFDNELKKIILSQKLYDNRLIMEDKELHDLVTRLK